MKEAEKLTEYGYIQLTFQACSKRIGGHMCATSHIGTCMCTRLNSLCDFSTILHGFICRIRKTVPHIDPGLTMEIWRIRKISGHLGLRITCLQ